MINKRSGKIICASSRTKNSSNLCCLYFLIVSWEKSFFPFDFLKLELGQKFSILSFVKEIFYLKFLNKITVLVKRFFLFFLVLSKDWQKASFQCHSLTALYLLIFSKDWETTSTVFLKFKKLSGSKWKRLHTQMHVNNKEHVRPLFLSLFYKQILLKFYFWPHLLNKFSSKYNSSL